MSRPARPALLSAATAVACALALTGPGALGSADAAGLTSGPVQRGIATFSTKPTAAQVDALRSLGLTVQPMKSLPLVLVAGPAGALAKATGIAQDVYPDEQLQYLDTASTNVMSSSTSAAKGLRARGFTGKGVTVGVIDSGCDATHPDLADHVVKNEILLSPEYANQQPTKDSTLVVPVDQARLFVQELRRTSKRSVVYAELPGAQHAFDVFPSIRSSHIVRAIDRYLHWHWNQYRRERQPA